MDNNADNVSTTTTKLENKTSSLLVGAATPSSSDPSPSSSSSAAISIVAAQTSQQFSTSKQQPQQTATIVNTNSFWKNSNRIVPGRPSPKRVAHHLSAAGGGVGGAAEGYHIVGGVMMATFRDYQNSVSDAWDTGDDEFCIISSATQQQLHGVGRGADDCAAAGIHKTGKIMGGVNEPRDSF